MHTGTGLDRLVDSILNDDGLRARLPIDEIEAGAKAAAQMNAMIIEAIRATGVAGDGNLTAGDVRTLSDWLALNRADAFIEAHGDDENGSETGFHLVQNDGGSGRLFGKRAVDTVADGIYHLVFGYKGRQIINEDGNRNASLEDIAWWMNTLLEGDLAAAARGEGPLATDIDPYAPIERSGTGMDKLIDTALADPGLQRNVSTTEHVEGVAAGAGISAMILEQIEAQGLANDGKITASDVYAINAGIRDDSALLEKFKALHGDDEDGSETGFHLIQNDGDELQLFGDDAVDTVMDGIYHIGFETRNGRLLNEDGNNNASLKTVAAWLDSLLADDLAAGTLKNDSVSPVPTGTTGTGLDRLVDIVTSDIGLERKIPLADIAGGAKSANDLNNLFLEGVRETGVANDGAIDTADLRDVNAWLRADAGRLATFIELHGDDENNEETGFHLVQNDGAETRLFGENAVNTVADGLYHFGFAIKGNNFLNEDGNRNAAVEDVAAWVSALLSDADIADLSNDAVEAYIEGSTGTALDKLIPMVYADPGLVQRIATSEITAGLRAADGMNGMLIEALKETGVAEDGFISGADLYSVNGWLRADDNRIARWTALHGDDENGSETGFHLIQGDGDRSDILGRDLVDDVMDGLYHIGFEIERGRFLNEDGNLNVSVSTAAGWLNALLAEDLESGLFADPNPVPVDTSGLMDHVVFSGPDIEILNNQKGYAVLDGAGVPSLPAGTVLFGFTANTPEGGDKDVLFSRDARGNGDGHLTIWIQRNDLYARFQTETDEVKLKVDDAVVKGQGHSLGFTFDGTTARLYVDGTERAAAASTATWETADEDIALGVNIWARDARRPDWIGDHHNGTVTGLKVLDKVLTGDEIAALAGDTLVTPELPPSAFDEPALPDGTTGTGLDAIVDLITNDVGLLARIPLADIEVGALAADGMNHLIVQGLNETGLGNDGRITAADVRTLSDWSVENVRAPFVELHGDDEAGVETGFHRVQNDGDEGRIFGDAAIDTVADGIYHLPFGYRRDRLINEDGNNNARLEDVAWWLSEFLADDLAAAAQGAGPIYSTVDAYAVPQTVTGFDQVAEVILNDIGLEEKTSTEDMVVGATSGMIIAQMILDGIAAYGLADDGMITTADMRAVNAYIRSDADRLAAFVEAHGDDENNEETGYHRVQNDGAETYLYGKNAVNTVFDGIFHAGFKIKGDNFLNEDGNRNARVEDVAWWVSELLRADLASGALASGKAPSFGSTGTGLDTLPSLIMADHGLIEKISTLDMRGGAEAADAMNAMIRDAIVATGVAKNGLIQTSDVYAINEWLRADPDRLARWIDLHGDDEQGREWGFHLVQNDGGRLRLFDERAIDTVADGIYHLGFEIEKGRLLNEDGNRNASVASVGGWLDALLSDADLAQLAAESTVDPYLYGSTGTGLDTLVATITQDDGLIEKLSTTTIQQGAAAADAMNAIILEGIVELGLANDDGINAYDVIALDQWIASDAARAAEMAALHGDDRPGPDTGLHVVVDNGDKADLFGEDAVDEVADGIYSLGFGIERDRLLDEDGRRGERVSDVADWLDSLLAEDIAAGSLDNDALQPDDVDLATLRAGRVLAIEDPFDVDKSGGEQEFDSTDAFALEAATIAMAFTAEDSDERGRDSLFSRDGFGYQDGGHLTAHVERGDLHVRFQTDHDQVQLRANDVIAEGQAQHLALTFDGAVINAYVDGQLVDSEAFDADWTTADENIVFGADLTRRRDGDDRVDNRFEGDILLAEIFDTALAPHEVLALNNDFFA